MPIELSQWWASDALLTIATHRDRKYSFMSRSGVTVDVKMELLHTIGTVLPRWIIWWGAYWYNCGIYSVRFTLWCSCNTNHNTPKLSSMLIFLQSSIPFCLTTLSNLCCCPVQPDSNPASLAGHIVYMSLLSGFYIWNI